MQCDMNINLTIFFMVKINWPMRKAIMNVFEQFDRLLNMLVDLFE